MRYQLAVPAIVVLALALSARADEAKPAPFKDVEIVSQIVASDLPDKERRHPCKVHTLKLDKGQTYVLDMISRDFDTWLRIADAQGKTLAQDDDSGGGLNSRIRFTAPKDETYQIVATSYGGGGGTYILKVRLDGAAAKPAVKTVALKMEGDKLTHNGQLADDDPRDTMRNQPSKTHTLRLPKGKTCVIDLESAAFDPFLRLADPAGKQLAFDDDGGGFPNARIRFTAAADGEYRLIVTTFDGKTGNYVLKVRTE